jgi:hypothetical protein
MTMCGMCWITEFRKLLAVSSSAVRDRTRSSSSAFKARRSSSARRSATRSFCSISARATEVHSRCSRCFNT